jgi:hypothetical protein
MIGNCLHEDVQITAALIGENPSAHENTLVELLVAQGYDPLRAELLVVFVPLGLARPVIARLEANPPIDLPDIAFVEDYARNRKLEVRLTDVPEFTATCELGEQHYQTGIIPREHFSAAAGFSVELHLTSDILSTGRDIGGTKIFPSVLLRLGDTPGFEEWYRGVKPKNIFQSCVSKLKGSPVMASLL